MQLTVDIMNDIFSKDVIVVFRECMKGKGKKRYSYYALEETISSPTRMRMTGS